MIPSQSTSEFNKGKVDIIVLYIGFIVIIISLLAIEGQLRKASKQNEEIIKLLKEIKEK